MTAKSKFKIFPY